MIGTLEILAWILVAVELQTGVVLLAIWSFRAGDGFVHLRLSGIVVTAYSSGRDRHYVRKGERCQAARPIRPSLAY